MLAEATDWLLRWGEVIGGLGSVLLTGALVVLYRQQKDILSQTFRVNNRAILEVDDSGLSNEDHHLKVSNVGEGVGLSPEMIVAGVYTHSSGNVFSGVTTNRLNRLDRGEQNTPGSIRPDEHEIPLVSRFSLPSIHGGNRAEFFTAIRELDNEDIEVARIHTWIRYSNLTEKYRTQVDVFRVDRFEDVTFCFR